MVFYIPGIRTASFGSSHAVAKATEVPKGYFAVAVGESQKKLVIPISYLNQPAFQELLSQVEQEFGYDHPMGGCTLPCGDDIFLELISSLNGL